MRKPSVEEREIFRAGKRMRVGDDDDIEGRGKAEKEGPAEEAGVVVEAVRVNKDGTMVSRGGG